MKKRIVARRLLSVTSFFVIICFIICFGQEYLFVLDDHNPWRIKGFYYEEKNSLDVVFIGASDVYSGICPGKLYEEYGITSYDYAAASSEVNLWLSQLKEVLKHQNPQCIVMDINGVVYEDDSGLESNQGLRWYLDGMPLSWNKIVTIMNSKLEEDPASYFFPFIKYHGELSNAKKTLRQNLYYKKQGYTALKGFYTQTKMDVREDTIAFDKNKELPLTEKREKLLVEFLEYCKEEKINIVFTRFPHKIMREEMINRAYRSNRAERIVREYGFDFVNLERDCSETNIDILTDYYDDDHLNVYGAQKLTSYWGDLLTSKYGVVPQTLTQGQQQEWNYCTDYTNRFLAMAETRIANGSGGVFYERAYLKAELFGSE